MTKKHAKLSASGSDKWINCPGSVEAESKYTNRGSSSYAEEGTLAHEIADRCLKKGCDANYFLGKTLKELKIKFDTIPPDYEIEEDMVENVQEYIDYVRSHEHENTKFFTEERVNFSNVVPEGFGTVDSAVLDYSTGICHIFDLKYGKGVRVYAQENNQGKMYAIGFYNELAFLGLIKSFRIHIIQPRIYNYSSWDITVEELEEFSKFVKERAELALSKNAPRIPGPKQCQWCAAQGDCKALYDFTSKALLAEFDEFDDLPDSNNLTDSQKKFILDHEDLILNFVSAVKENVDTSLRNGNTFEGYKLVEGTSRRVLIDGAEDIIVERLGEEAYKKKLLGLGELEKKLSKKEVNELTIKPKGKIIMVPESDRRPEVILENIANEFDMAGVE